MSDKFIFRGEHNGKINYSIPGVLTFAPLYMSKEEWLARGYKIPTKENN